MNMKQLFGYETVEAAHDCAELLKEEGIECLLTHREKGLFGDAETSDQTWILVSEVDFDRARQILAPPPIEDQDLDLELQCPRCRSIKVQFGIVDTTTGRKKTFTWPWDKEKFYCEDCKNVCDRKPDA